jgi:hypothetical protein
VAGLMNLGRLLRPCFDGGERAMILESRKYAVHDPSYNNDNNNYMNDNICENDNNDNKNSNKNTTSEDSDKDNNKDLDEDGVEGRKKGVDDVVNNEVENKVEVEGARTNSVTCTYYRPVLVIREEASKYGVRRACVLLGENGTYIRTCVNEQNQLFMNLLSFTLIYLYAFLFFYFFSSV